MKKIFLIFILIVPIFSFGQITNYQIMGAWKLDSMKTKEGVFMKGKVDYFISIKDSTLTYNKAVNNCAAVYHITAGDTLKLTNAGCTKMCCDEEKDNFSNYINYSGKIFMVKKDILISNNTGTFYFHRQRITH